MIIVNITSVIRHSVQMTKLNNSYSVYLYQGKTTNPFFNEIL